MRFYVEALGHEVKRRNDEVGLVGLSLRDGESELVLTTKHRYEPNWLVDSVDDAIRVILDHRGTVVAEQFEIPVGRVAVVLDTFGNALVLIDLSEGAYTTSEQGEVTGVA